MTSKKISLCPPLPKEDFGSHSQIGDATLERPRVNRPLKKAGRGDFFSSTLLWFSIVLTLLLDSTTVFAQACLSFKKDRQLGHIVPTTPGNQLRIRFTHSIYGGTVEEIFTVREQGFELQQLRYGEARLVAFYGHEGAREENGSWVVTPGPLLYPVLNLRVSDDSAMTLALISATKSHEFLLPPGGALRVAVAACEAGSDG
ncbi:MAG: DUF1850 domain-containing protein [Deltaproteobacteria bacterium]|nr:DUF1850 domain-containing protein [Deltaproteobacteria bacterium]